MIGASILLGLVLGMFVEWRVGGHRKTDGSRRGETKGEL